MNIVTLIFQSWQETQDYYYVFYHLKNEIQQSQPLNKNHLESAMSAAPEMMDSSLSSKLGLTLDSS